MVRDHLCTLSLSLVLGILVFVAGTCMVDGHVRTPLPPMIVEAGCHRENATDVDGSGVEGRAKLCAMEDGVHLAMEADNLIVGHPYTVWLAYFDRPTECQWRPCWLGDALGDDAVGVLGRMDGHVADRSTEVFAGDFRGLRFSRGSQVALYLLMHSAVINDDNRVRARKLLTYEAIHIGVPTSDAPLDGDWGAAAARAVFTIR